MLVLIISLVLISPTYAEQDVSDSYQVKCEFGYLIAAINKTIDQMKLTVKDYNTSINTAFYSLDQGMKWSTNSNPIYYKVTVFKENEGYNLRVTVGTYKFSLVQKSLNNKYLKLFIENVKKYLAQEIEENGGTEEQENKGKINCPACKELIATDAIVCMYCKSNIGLVKSPSNLIIASKQLNQVDLSWKDESNNEDGFFIERKAGDGVYVKIATVDKNTEYYCDKALISGQQYFYRIRAFNIECTSESSNEVSFIPKF